MQLENGYTKDNFHIHIEGIVPEEAKPYLIISQSIVLIY